MSITRVHYQRERRQVKASRVNEMADYINWQRPVDYEHHHLTYPGSESSGFLAKILGHSEEQPYKHAWAEVSFNTATGTFTETSNVGDLSDPIYLFSPPDSDQFVPTSVIVQVIVDENDIKIIRVTNPIACVVSSVKKNYLRCTLPTEEEEFDVAKPSLLQEYASRVELAGSATFEYLTESGQTRKAKSGLKEEDQYVLPSYQAGDFILASNASGGTQTTNEQGKRIYFVDLNIDGRFWAALPPSAT